MGIMHSPAEVRAFARSDDMATTAGHARGFMQANLIALPREYAFDFLLFAQRNPKPCPIVGVFEAGEFTSNLIPGGDIRTDIPAYNIYEDGQLTHTLNDATPFYSPDTVSFLIGCSFTFENALLENGISIAHIDQGRNVPMYRTSIATTPAGVFSGPMVVSMRPIPANQVSDAVRITSRYPAVHGAPVHVGDPAAIGIDDLSQPDFGEAIDIPEGTIPVFWACGVTPQAIVMNSRPSLAITHAPGKMLVTDIPDRDFLIP